MTSQNIHRRWIVAPPAADAEVRLFCFPPAGAGAATYRLWSAELSPEIDVFRIQPPGRESRFRESRCTDIETYLEELMPELLPLLDQPFAFFGHSMGSLIAFRLTQRLQHEYSLIPMHLIISSFHPPQAIPNEHIRNLPQEAFIRELRDRYDGIPDQILEEPDLLELMLPIIRDDLAIVESYSYQCQPSLLCPISAFGGFTDKWVNESQLYRWCECTTAEFGVSMFPGNHYYLDPALSDLISAIRRALL